MRTTCEGPRARRAVVDTATVTSSGGCMRRICRGFGLSCRCFVHFKPFWPLALVHQTRVAIDSIAWRAWHGCPFVIDAVSAASCVADVGCAPVAAGSRGGHPTQEIWRPPSALCGQSRGHRAHSPRRWKRLSQGNLDVIDLPAVLPPHCAHRAFNTSRNTRCAASGIPRNIRMGNGSPGPAMPRKLRAGA